MLSNALHTAPLAKRTWWFVALLSALTFAFHLFVAADVLGAYPSSMDEYANLYQSQIFLRGEVAYRPLRFHGSLLETWMFHSKEGVFSKYPPGFALVLSVGTYVGVPWFVNPALSALSVVLFFLLARTFVSGAMAATGALLLASCPYFTGYSASFYPQPLALLLTLSALYAARGYERTERRCFVCVLGMTVGICFWVRQLDAFILLAALGGYQVVTRPSARTAKDICFWMGISALFVVGLMYYNAQLTGRLSISTYPVVDSEFQVLPQGEGSVLLRVLLAVQNALARLRVEGALLWNTYFLPYTGYVIPVMAFAGIFVTSLPKQWRALLVFLIGLNVALYSFHKAAASEFPGWPLYGARYWYAVFPCWVLLATAVLDTLYGRLARMRLRVDAPIVVAVTVIVAIHVYRGEIYLTEYRQRTKAVRAAQRLIESKCPGKRIVQLRRFTVTTDAPPPYFMFHDLKRNPFMNAQKLYVIGIAHPSLTGLFRDYEPCIFDLTSAELHGSIAPPNPQTAP